MPERNNPHSLGNAKIRIGVDLMGSDTAPDVLFQGILQNFVSPDPALELVLIGTDALFANKVAPHGISFLRAKEVIAMDDDPLTAVRRKKDSSLCIGMNLLHKKELSGFVSPGNTGALVASATLTLSMLPGIDRPALLALLPTKGREMAVLDVGAGVGCKVEHLVQFALMGLAFQKSRGIENPTIGLLNIGSEENKGTPELREAYQKLQVLSRNSEPPIFFMGNIEGRNVFKGEIDVLVTDGFTGNVFLKTSEGTAAFILDELEENMPKESAILAQHRSRLYYAEYPGAIVCGVDGVVVKCHGDTTPASLLNSITATIELVRNSFLERIKTLLTTYLA